MERILLGNIKKQDRPYSQAELNDLRIKSLSRCRVGRVMVSHSQCGHFYFAKEGGKKEQIAIETNGEDCGSCSVCWQLKKTPLELREAANSLIEAYHYNFEVKPKKWTLYLFELEKTFYRWIYFDDRKRKKNNSIPEENVNVQIKETNSETDEFPSLT